MLGAPDLVAGLLGGSQQCRAEGHPLPPPAAHAAGDAAQDALDFFGCERTLPGLKSLCLHPPGISRNFTT